MSDESVEQLIESIRDHRKDTENNYNSEEVEKKYQKGQDGGNIQQAAPEQERRRSEKPQPQVRNHAQNPRS